jgi:hypothetical protein
MCRPFAQPAARSSLPDWLLRRLRPLNGDISSKTPWQVSTIALAADKSDISLSTVARP